MKLLDKKAMMDDLFDFLFTVIVAFFLFFFISIVLSAGDNQKAENTNLLVKQMEVRNDFLQFLQMGTEVDRKKYSMLELVELMPEAGNQARSDAFKRSALEFFKARYPSNPEWEKIGTQAWIPRPWALKLYDSLELIDKGDEGGVFDNVNLQGEQNEDFISNELTEEENGMECDQARTKNTLVVVPVKLKGGKEVQLVFCVRNDYLSPPK